MERKARVTTKKQALDVFINEHVLGNRPFAYSEREATCKYSHHVNGGCAVGRHLPEQLAEALDNEKMGSYSTASLSSRYAGKFRELLEDSTSDFWQRLQTAHDNLALSNRNKDYEGDEQYHSTGWWWFQQALREVVDCL